MHDESQRGLTAITCVCNKKYSEVDGKPKVNFSGDKRESFFFFSAQHGCLELAKIFLNIIKK